MLGKQRNGPTSTVKLTSCVSSRNSDARTMIPLPLTRILTASLQDGQSLRSCALCAIRLLGSGS